ncbi:MAG: Fe-S cluster assembly protein SufD [Actinobacteria bacterium]|nr:Fe-S cluster assembly protein SufD [Actinomycetota bacterium]
MSAVTEHEVSLVPATDHSPTIVSLDVTDFPVPTGREEEWRFTPLKRLGGLHEAVTPSGSALSVTAEVTDGVTFDANAEKSAERRGFTDRVSAAAWGEISTVASVNIPANAQVGTAQTVTVSGNGAHQYGQIDITAGAHSKAVVIVNHVGSGTSAINLDINAGDGASLTVVSLQDWADDATHVGQHRITVGRDSSVKHVLVTLGGDLVRILPSVHYTAPGGSVDLIGLYFAGAGQHAEQRLFVDHSVENCRSNVMYKGALNGKDAHTVWVGDVLIRSNAIGTDTYEINRNLVLSEGGRADSVPNLEIETGEITGAGHASTTGRFDDEQLFYLESRGIPAEEARRLVLRGFFEDLLNQIAVPEINDTVRERLETKLAGGA